MGTSLALGVLLLTAFATTARAEPEVPDTEGVVAGYLAVRRWTDAFDAPAPEAAEARLPIDGAAGVCVILRKRGRVVGTGVDLEGDALATRRAAGRALAGVLGNRAVSRLPDALRADVGRGLTLELEVAGRLVPLPGRTYAQLAAQVEPGLDGIALRRGETLVAMFPAQMRAADTARAVERLLPVLAVDMGLPAAPWATLRRAHDISAYRFRTIHLTQRAPGRSPFETWRGQRLVVTRDVTDAALRELAQAMVLHVIAGLWAGDEPLGLMGDYAPVADRYEPLVARARDQALTALAAARYATVPDLTEDDRREAIGTAGVILTFLTAQTPGESDPRVDPAACAAIVLAHAALPDGALDDEIAAATGPLADAAATAVTLADGSALSAHDQALVAAALARLLTLQHPGVDAAAVRAAIDGAWSSVPEPQRISLLPWIVWAEADYAHATGAPRAGDEELRRLRAALAQASFGEGRQGPPDLHGGFSLSSTGPPVATAQSARPAVALAVMLGDAALTPPEEVAAARTRLRETLRFIMQLTLRDPMLWAVPVPERALGGVRAAPWSLEQPVAAHAMSLLAVAEALHALSATAPPDVP